MDGSLVTSRLKKTASPILWTKQKPLVNIGAFLLTLYLTYVILLVEDDMKNKFAGRCCYCACSVSSGEGRCWKWDETKKWYVACEDCFQEKKEERKQK